MKAFRLKTSPLFEYWMAVALVNGKCDDAAVKGKMFKLLFKHSMNAVKALATDGFRRATGSGFAINPLSTPNINRKTEAEAIF